MIIDEYELFKDRDGDYVEDYWEWRICLCSRGIEEFFWLEGSKRIQLVIEDQPSKTGKKFWISPGGLDVLRWKGAVGPGFIVMTDSLGNKFNRWASQNRGKPFWVTIYLLPDDA